MEKGMSISKKAVALMLMAVMLLAAVPVISAPAFTAEAEAVTATGKINTKGLVLRKSASTSSGKVTTLSKNKKVTIQREVFKKKNSTKSSDRWYYITAGGKSGYVRSNRVSNISWSDTAAVTTDELNYRTGPDTSFKRVGTTRTGESVTLMLPAKLSGSSSEWYRAKVRGKTVYISAAYVKFGKSLFIQKTTKELSGKSELAKDLLSNPTRGGKARVVYTFTPDNCTKEFAIKGTAIATVPQGFTFTGDKYYILYGMAAGQSIVTYSSDGTRLDESDFSFCMGHPNGITWDPVTKMCYIFKGNQKTIYTWNPSTDKFGKAKTPYSSSGVGYDNTTGLLYASSQTGIRAYSADGKFTHKALFSRCTPAFSHYIQDCGAGEGFIFHGVSGSDKKVTNQLDIYRAADQAYLGSIKITMGEYESAVVGPDGYLHLLINNDGRVDYVWRTPLKLSELK